ncbi:MAG: putative ABC transporter permease, partial [Eggerthellaceae bacterium]|nr:putative ABC transporter permease [Eggerthellaceae bacterium]
ATLVNDIANGDGAYDKDDFVVNRQGWPFIRNLIIYFIVFSIIGHWMEMGMCQFIIMGVVQGEYDPTNTMLWRDWLYPFPMEGAAVVVIGLVLYPFFVWLKKKFIGKKRWLAYVISFFAGALLCTIIEGGMGLIVNADLQLWDYRENFANIGGQVCLQNTMAFGVVAAIITWWVYPMLERMIARVPRDIMNIVAVVIFVFGAIVWSLYLIDLPGSDGQGADPTEIVQQQVEEQKIAARGELGDVADAIGTTNDALREAVGKSLALGDDEKARILAEIDDISESVKAIEGELATAE